MLGVFTNLSGKLCGWILDRVEDTRRRVNMVSARELPTNHAVAVYEYE